MEASQFLAENPQFIVNGFRRAGISMALDGKTGDTDEVDDDEDTDDLDDY